jgi:1-acyl-sn-glycerol-3-phosphate acyltransferase
VNRTTSQSRSTRTATLLRRALTIPAVCALCAVATLALPLWLPLAALASALPAARGSLRCAAFLTGYLWCEVIGIAVAGWLWLHHRPARRRADAAAVAAWLDANYALQAWWVCTLHALAARIFALHFAVDGDDALAGPPAIVLPRHASIADTVIPLAFYALPRGIRLRYVLKRELLLDPCLDIVGNRTPNCFVDRTAADSAPQLAAIATLADALPGDAGIVIYPEGTRFSDSRRAQVIASLARGDAAAAARAEGLRHVLPPRPGGTLALLARNPGRDILCCAHAGFEGSRDFLSLVNGSWTGSRVRIRFFRVPFGAIPADAAARRAFLFALWERMDREVATLLAAPAG